MERYNWQGKLEEWYDALPHHTGKPVIGITGNIGDRGCELAEGYFKSIESAGGIPFVLPPSNNLNLLAAALDRIDGLLLSGGADLNPLYLKQDPLPSLHTINHRRDESELLLIRLAFNRQIPILGICRGCQLLAAALGGDIYQDLQACYPDSARLLKHSQEADRCVATHQVQLVAGTVLDQLLPGGIRAVNSFHHQAVSNPGPHLQVSARSADGVIEAIESNEEKAILAVQWHPECFITVSDPCMLPLFGWLTAQARAYRATQRLHNRMLSLDSHCDTPMWFDRGVRFDRRDPQLLVDLHKMTEGRLDATIMVAYLKQGARDEDAHRAATEKAHHILTQIETMLEGLQGAAARAYTPADLYRLKQQGVKAVMTGIENGYAIGRDLANIEAFRRRGVVYMTLCHNGNNDLCDSARDLPEHNGLSELGRQAVAEMNRTGMMVDLSHAAEKTFYDAIEASRVPIVCSHSSARALCNHPRNLTDDQLRALAASGGVAQATFYAGFLREQGNASLTDAVAHINHMVSIAGIDHVGIGTDFDGDGGIPGLASVAELPNLTRRLMAEGYTDEDLKKLWGENFLRVMELAQQAAC